MGSTQSTWGCTTEPPPSEAALSPSSPRTWTTSPSLADLMSEAQTSPTPTAPLSTRCTGATSNPHQLPATRSLAPADGLPPLATLFAVKLKTQICFPLVFSRLND